LWELFYREYGYQFSRLTDTTCHQSSSANKSLAIRNVGLRPPLVPLEAFEATAVATCAYGENWSGDDFLSKNQIRAVHYVPVIIIDMEWNYGKAANVRCCLLHIVLFGLLRLFYTCPASGCKILRNETNITFHIYTLLRILYY
jgi:hypothetical protein